MTIKHKLEWRYATKHFDASKKISEEDITYLLETMNLSASALGLQPYKFIVIKDQKIKKELAKHSFQGIDVSDASHIILIASKKEISKEYILDFISRTEKIRGLNKGSLKDLEELTLGLIGAKNKDEIFMWSQKQAYVAMGTLIIAAADLKIDMCPMEVFDAGKYNEILDLHNQGLHACVAGVLGYRKHDDKDQFMKKSRIPLEDMVYLKY
jgi:nitroreductase